MSTFAILTIRLFRYYFVHELFLRISEAVKIQDDFFVQKRNAAGKLGLATLQKTTAALQMLAYGFFADSVDEYVRIGKSTAIESLTRFCTAVDEVFSAEYLKKPTEADIERLCAEGEERGFTGMIGSIDCMHWEWKNCPTAYHGQYKGKEGVPTIILEAVASKDMWISHAFFGLPGTLNEINVLDCSPVFSSFENGHTPELPFVINRNTYNMGYYLADGIYPNYTNLVKSFKHPLTPKEKKRELVKDDADLYTDKPLKIGNITELVEFLNTVYLPFDPKNEEVYENKCLTTKEILATVWKYSDLHKDKSAIGFAKWCKNRNIKFMSSSIKRKESESQTNRVRSLYL